MDMVKEECLVSRIERLQKQNIVSFYFFIHIIELDFTNYNKHNKYKINTERSKILQGTVTDNKNFRKSRDIFYKTQKTNYNLEHCFSVSQLAQMKFQKFSKIKQKVMKQVFKEQLV